MFILLLVDKQPLFHFKKFQILLFTYLYAQMLLFYACILFTPKYYYLFSPCSIGLLHIALLFSYSIGGVNRPLAQIQERATDPQIAVGRESKNFGLSVETTTIQLR